MVFPISDVSLLPHTDEFYPGDTGGSLYDGGKQVLYWADVCSEVAFVVPSPDAFQPPVRRPSLDSQTSTGEQLTLCSILFLDTTEFVF